MSTKGILHARIAGAVLGLLMTSHALATPVMIDFTDSRWSGASGQSSFAQTYGTIEVTMSSSNTGPLTFNAGGPASGGSLALHGDGIGIGDDEIGLGTESLNVAFSSAVTILGYYFLDLFGNEGLNGEGEYALVSVADALGSIFLDTGAATDGIGYYGREGLELLGSTAISFSASIAENYSARNFPFSDFALAGILIEDSTATAVPEPAIFGLLCVGLMGLGFSRRRRS